MLYKTHSGTVLLNYSYGMQVFAHPEAQIGFHPDAGASFYLSRLPGYLGNTRLSLLLYMHYLYMFCLISYFYFLVNQNFSPFLDTIMVFFVSGEYMALTGDKLNGAEMIACGLASHYVLHEVCFHCNLLLDSFFFTLCLHP